jgi:hypothetical protein
MASNGEGGVRPPLSQEARNRGTACSYHDQMLAGGHCSHSGYGDNSTVGIGTVVGHWPLHRAMMRFSGRAMGASPHSATQHRA